MMTSEPNTARISAHDVLRNDAFLPVRHGFFTRAGGVSSGPYASLNCSMRSGDEPAHLVENRRRVADFLAVAPDRLMGVTQVHGAGVAVVDQPWTTGQGPEADALVTMREDVAVGVITADCGPVLLISGDGRIAGAAHAGWRGAACGVLEAVVQAMVDLGADRSGVRAVVGPCIGPQGYEVGEDMRSSLFQQDAKSEEFFSSAPRDGHFFFNLPGYCIARLQRAGVSQVTALGLDTLSDEARFFSHRRRTLAGGGPIGHQISAISPGLMQN